MLCYRLLFFFTGFFYVLGNSNLCRAVLSYGMLCHIMACYTVGSPLFYFSFSMLRHAISVLLIAEHVLFHPGLCDAMLCYAMLCLYIIPSTEWGAGSPLCCAMLRYVMLCYISS